MSNQEIKVVNKVKSRLDLVYTHTDNYETTLSTVPLGQEEKVTLRRLVKEGFTTPEPIWRYVCVFQYEEGDKLFPLPKLLELKEGEITPWLRKVKINLLKEIIG